MAALQTIRGKAGLLVTVLGVALLAFILGDFFSSGNAFFNKMKDNAFSVDGEVVPTQKYQDRVTQMEEYMKTLYNRSSLDEATSSRLKEEVYQQMVKELMLNDQAEVLGLTVTPEELYQMVYGDDISPVLLRHPLFQNRETGGFDPSYFQYFMTMANQDINTTPDEQKMDVLNIKSIWLIIEDQIKLQRLEEKYTSLVAGTVLVNNTEVKAFQEDSKQEANLGYVVRNYTSVSDSVVTVSETDITNLYNKRKNNYKLDGELRKISYFIKDLIPSEEDYAAIQKEMDAAAVKLSESSNPELIVNDFSDNHYYDAFVSIANLPANVQNFVNSAKTGEVYGPIKENESFVLHQLIDKTVGADSLKCQMIAFPSELDMDVMEFVADSLYNVIKKGKSFADVANELNPGANGGELPMVDEMTWVASGLPKECVTASVGSVLNVKIMGQPRLIRVMAKSKPVAKAKLASIEMKVVISDKTQNSLDNELAQFVNEYGSLEKFNEGANNQGYSLVANSIIPPTASTLEQTPSTRQVIHWAFSEKAGAVKKFDLSDKRIIAIVTKVITDEYLPVSEVKDVLKAELVIDKKAEYIISDLKSKNLTSLESYAEDIETRIDSAKFVTFQTNQISGAGYEPVINAYAKLANQGTMSQPMQGFGGVYVMNIDSKRESATPLDETQVKERILQANLYQLMSGATMALSTKMDVKDNRVKFW